MGTIDTSKKLSNTIKFSIAMAQELQEIIGDATESGCINPLPATQALLDEWEAFYKEQNLINEVWA